MHHTVQRKNKFVIWAINSISLRMSLCYEQSIDHYAVNEVQEPSAYQNIDQICHNNRAP
jgi:hypothetical protein